MDSKGKKNKFPAKVFTSNFWYGTHVVWQMLNAIEQRKINFSGKLFYARNEKEKSREHDWDFLARKINIEVRNIPKLEIDSMVGHQDHQSILLQGFFPLPAITQESIFSDTEGLYIGLENVEDPRNLGAIARTSLGLGAKAIIITKHRSAKITAAAMKASAGALVWLPVLSVAGMPAFLHNLARKNPMMARVGTAMDGDPIQDVLPAIKNSPSKILIFGSESKGLSRLTKQRCDTLAALPQRGHISSYNISVAVGMMAISVVNFSQ